MNKRINKISSIVLQAVLKNRQRFSIITRVKNSQPSMITTAYDFERDLMNIALLPSQFMNEAFDDLLGSLAVNVHLYEIFEPLFAYYRAQWLTKIGPNNYSVYGRSTRCNNVTERYHRALKEKTATRPEISKFFGESNNRH